jgi:hypothetical protein
LALALLLLPDASQKHAEKQKAAQEAARTYDRERLELGEIQVLRDQIVQSQQKLQEELANLSSEDPGRLQWKLSGVLHDLARTHGVRLQSVKYGSPTREGTKGSGLEVMEAEFAVVGLYSSMKPFMKELEEKANPTPKAGSEEKVSQEPSKLPFALSTVRLEETPEGARLSAVLRDAMNASAKNDPKAWLQELKSNRRTQAALGGFALVLIYLLWPSSSKPRRKGAHVSSSASASLGDRQLQALRTLPDLAKLGQAGHVPDETRVFHDLFLFDAPLPPPPPPKPEPPPKPPTEEELERSRQEAAKNMENNTRPQDLRYLGFLESTSAGRLGAFMKGEEPITMKVGGLPNPSWRLVLVTDKFAEFQNLKYPDLRHRLEVRDTNATPGQMPSNEF